MYQDLQILETESAEKYLIRCNDQSMYVGYLVKSIIEFLQENKIGLPIDSIFYNQVCKFGIEALTETSVAIIAYEHWANLSKDNPALQQFSQQLMVDYIKNATDRIYNLKFRSPRERYDTMLSEFRALFLHIPLGHIASYLGITQETLSRLRAEK